MEGGITAWDGLVAEGPPETGMAYFTPAVRPEELIALAWYLEAGSRAFYAGLAARVSDSESAALYGQLGQAEERHMASLSGLYQRLAGAPPAAGFPQELLRQEPPDALMEGGVEVAKALAWSSGKPPADLLEYCVSLETNSYDLYLRMRAATEQPEGRQVFELLAEEELRHLERLSARLEQLTGGAAAGDAP